MIVTYPTRPNKTAACFLADTMTNGARLRRRKTVDRTVAVKRAIQPAAGEGNRQTSCARHKISLAAPKHGSMLTRAGPKTNIEYP